jgi:hypothetical protein
VHGARGRHDASLRPFHEGLSSWGVGLFLSCLDFLSVSVHRGTIYVQFHHLFSHVYPRAIGNRPMNYVYGTLRVMNTTCTTCIFPLHLRRDKTPRSIVHSSPPILFVLNDMTSGLLWAQGWSALQPSAL